MKEGEEKKGECVPFKGQLERQKEAAERECGVQYTCAVYSIRVRVHVKLTDTCREGEWLRE